MKLLIELYESAFSHESAILQMVNIANSMSRLYMSVLPDRLQSAYIGDPNKVEKVNKFTDDPDKVAKLLVGSAKGKWFSDNYLSSKSFNLDGGLKTAAYTISRDPKFQGIKKQLSRIADFSVNMNKAKQSVDDRSNSNYVNELESLLPQTLRLIAKITPIFGDQCIQAAVRLENAVSSFNSTWSRYQYNLGPSNDDLQKEKERRDRKAEQSKLGRENVEIDGIINHVLSTIDKKIAAEVRPIVARSGDKLQTLQIELSRRGVKLQG